MKGWFRFYKAGKAELEGDRSFAFIAFRRRCVAAARLPLARFTVLWWSVAATLMVSGNLEEM